MITTEAEASVKAAIRRFAILRGRFELIFLAQKPSPWPELLPTETWVKWILEELEASDSRLTNEHTKPKRHSERNPKSGRYETARDDRVQPSQDRSRREGSPGGASDSTPENPLAASLPSFDVAHATRRISSGWNRKRNSPPPSWKSKRRRARATRARRATQNQTQS